MRKTTEKVVEMVSPESLIEEPQRLDLDKSEPEIDLTIQSEFIYEDMSPVQKQVSGVSLGASPTD